MKTGRFVEAAARFEMRERDPGVLRIPNDRRNGAEGENERGANKGSAAEIRDAIRGRRRTSKNRDQLERVGEFAEKPKADEQPGERPPPGKERAPLERKPEGVERRHPEENRERIDRHDEAAEIENRRHVQRDDSPETGERAKETLGEIVKKQARAGGKERAPKAHPEFVVAKDRGARPNDEGDTGPFAEIGERRPLAPTSSNRPRPARAASRSIAPGESRSERTEKAKPRASCS